MGYPKTNSPYLQVAIDAAKKHGIDPEIFARQIYQESGFNPNAHNTTIGMGGIAQIYQKYHPEMVGKTGDPYKSLDYAAKLMSGYVKTYKNKGFDDHKAYALALATYNSGAGNVQKAGYNVPAIGETQNYVKNILGDSQPKQIASTQNAGPGLYQQLQNSIKQGWDSFFNPIQKQVQHDVKQYQQQGQEVANGWQDFFNRPHGPSAAPGPSQHNDWAEFFAPQAVASDTAPKPPAQLPAHTNTVMGEAPAPVVPPAPVLPAPPVVAQHTPTPIPDFNTLPSVIPPYAGAGNQNLPQFQGADLTQLNNAIQQSVAQPAWTPPAPNPVPANIANQVYGQVSTPQAPQHDLSRFEPVPIPKDQRHPVGSSSPGGLGNIGDFFNSAINAGTADITAQPEADNFASGVGRFVGGLAPIAGGALLGSLGGPIGTIAGGIAGAAGAGAGQSLRADERARKPLNYGKAAINAVGTGAIQAIAPGEGAIIPRILRQGVLGGVLGGATEAGSELAGGEKLDARRIGKSAAMSGLMTAGGPVVHRLLGGEKPKINAEDTGPVGAVKGWPTPPSETFTPHEVNTSRPPSETFTPEIRQPKSAQESASVLESGINKAEKTIQQHEQYKQALAQSEQEMIQKTGAPDVVEAQKVLAGHINENEKLAQNAIDEASALHPASPEYKAAYDRAGMFSDQAASDRALIKQTSDARAIVEMSAEDVNKGIADTTTPRSELPAPEQPSRNILDYVVQKEGNKNVSNSEPNGPTINNEVNTNNDISQLKKSEPVITPSGQRGRIQSITPERINVKTESGSIESVAPRDITQLNPVRKPVSPAIPETAPVESSTTNVSELPGVTTSPNQGQVFHQNQTPETVGQAVDKLATSLQKSGGQIMTVNEAKDFLKRTGRPGVEHLNNFVEAGKNNQSIEFKYNSLQSGRGEGAARDVTPFAIVKKPITPTTEFNNLLKEHGTPEAVRDKVVQRLRKYGAITKADEMRPTAYSIKKLIARLGEVSNGDELSHVYLQSHNLGDTTVTNGGTSRGYRLDTINESTMTGRKGVVPENTPYANEIAKSYQEAHAAAQEFNAKIDTVDQSLLPQAAKAELKKIMKGDITPDSIANLRKKLGNVAEEVCNLMGLH